MSVIELIGSEWAWAQSELDEFERDQAASQPPRTSFDEDALVARYRALETAITHFRPASSRDAAILAEVTAEQIHIRDTDHKLGAPLGENGRAAFFLRDYLCSQIGHSGMSLRAELLNGAGERNALSRTLIEALTGELLGAWKSHAAVDQAFVARPEDSELSKELDAKAMIIEDLELAIAASRIQSQSDLATVLLLFASDARTDKLERNRMSDLCSATISDYYARQGSGEFDEMVRRYTTKGRKTSSRICIVKDAAE